MQVNVAAPPTGMPEAELADPWISIGAFASRARLSTKALRLYERLGILRPAEVDPRTGYRRYRTSQLVTARLVRCCGDWTCR